MYFLCIKNLVGASQILNPYRLNSCEGSQSNAFVHMFVVLKLHAHPWASFKNTTLITIIEHRERTIVKQAIF